jgi:sugar lactone lactonase YvrE
MPISIPRETIAVGKGRWTYTGDEILQTGALNKGRVFANQTGVSRLDGLTTDADAGCWVCLLDADRGVRVGQGGTNPQAAVIPRGEPITGTVGGQDGRQILTTARAALARDDNYEEMMEKRVRA